MKVKLMFEGDAKAIHIEPESQAEALLLGTIIDPNAHSPSQLLKSAEVSAEVSEDRLPYRKVRRLVVTL